MATIALSAVGTALGGSLGGSILGLSMAVVGRAAGAVIGQRIDQQILGGGSEAVESGRIDRFRLTGASEGADVQQVFGRMRIAGQVIWASQFQEQSTTSGGKGSAPAPKTTTYSYTVSLAIALGEGRIARIGRIWADGTEIAPSGLNMRLYAGTDDQQPDPKIAAVEGLANTPAYRGTAYVVLEDLSLEQFGSRIPQLTFEVLRAAPEGDDVLSCVRAMQLMPTAGDYGLATTQLHTTDADGAQTAVNTNTPMGKADFGVSLDALAGELPTCQSVSLPVTWFGDDLRSGICQITPRVIDGQSDAAGMPWQVSGIARAQAVVMPPSGDTANCASTPADRSVTEAIVALKARGLSVMLQPTLLMTQSTDNTLVDPWTGDAGQGAMPWSGLITTALAHHLTGTSDGTSAADAEIAAFFGAAVPNDFSNSDGLITYAGPALGGYRRFVLHYAHLCAGAGGVDAFCIGTDLGGLTQVRGASGFPAVAALQTLAADVRTILGSGCKISYAADLDEYQGFTPKGTDDRLFPLDALWADAEIDFVGVNARLPLSDWRDGEDHVDASHRAPYDLEYLTGNVAGGEGFDWYYPSPEARAAQRRVPIADAMGEDWLARRKDFAGWWGNSHHVRIGGARSDTATNWVPRSKPIWFTKAGCAAIDKGANQIDPANQGAQVPYYSTGTRDDLIQMQYLRALHNHFEGTGNNPTSEIYGGPMLDAAHIHVTGWDPRPFPYWPGNQAMWSDGADYATGAWLNGRASHRTLASVVSEICHQWGVTDCDVSGLFGVVRGYTVSQIGTARAALQPLMLAYGFDAIERDGVMVFRNRGADVDHMLAHDTLALNPEADQALALTRMGAAEIAGRVQLDHLNADGDYDAVSAEAILPDDTTVATTRNEVPLVMTRAEGTRTANRWLQEARIARDKASFALPPSRSDIGAGDVVELQDALYRIDRIEENGVRLAEATRIDREVYRAQRGTDEQTQLRPFVGPVPAQMVFMDLPLLTGDELPHAPYVAASGNPWPGSIALYGAGQDSDYALKDVFAEAATVGTTQGALGRGPVGIWDRQLTLQVALSAGTFSSVTPEGLLAGANTIAIGGGSDGTWEIVQFTTATPVASGVFQLSGLLRGQLGSWGQMPDTWPSGSQVVALNGVPTQLALASAARGTLRHFRYGPSKYPMSDSSYRYETHSFAGNGLRPHPVVHLRGANLGGDTAFDWIRCTRIDGDIWADGDVPLGEDQERYVLRVLQGGVVQREVSLSNPKWTYTSAQRASDVGSGAYQVAVAQISDRYGAGPFTTRDITP